MNNVANFPLREYERGIGPPPARLDSDHARAWDQIVQAAPAGALSARHRIFVELTAAALVHYRKHFAEGNEAGCREWAGIARHELLMCKVPCSKIKGLLNTPNQKEQDCA